MNAKQDSYEIREAHNENDVYLKNSYENLVYFNAEDIVADGTQDKNRSCYHK